jgi:type I restriction enzyme S subunit
MVIKEGYKQTEFGIIPNDWELKEFVEVIDGFSSGQTPYRAITDYYKGDIPWITSGELNYNVIIDTIEKITIEGVKAAHLKTLPIGTFLFAITGLEAAGTRGSCGITGIKATTNQSCMALCPKKGLLTTPYLYHYYVRYGDELAFKYCQGTKQQSYSGAIAKKLPIIVPPSIKEQTAIATALSDADGLITGLEKLIAKKRNIKQGTMQQLLQPKEGWEVKKLGEVCNFQNGTALEIYFNKKDGYKVISIGNYSEKGIFNETNNFIAKYNYSFVKKFILNKGELAFLMNDKTAVGTIIGRVLYIEENDKYVFNQRTMRLSPNSEFIDSKFLFHLINSDHYHSLFVQLAKPGTQIYLNTNDVLDFEIIIPNSEEQAHIATILSDMDAELSALEQKLEKYKKVKLGMMQELLTGKTRLV